jgi:hypothetical protein
MIIYLNYTFSVPDKRLETLYKGITVTPRVVQASSVSSHDRATFTRGASCLCFVRRSFTRPLQPRVTEPSRRSRDQPSRHAIGTEAVHDPSSIALGFQDVPPRPPSPLSQGAPDTWRFRPFNAFSAEVTHPNPLRQRSGPLGRSVPTQQNSHNSSSISIFVKSSLHTPFVDPKPRVDRNQ